MKRSEINAAIIWAKELLQKNNIRLPAYAYWDMQTWMQNKSAIDTISKVMLGWDITDFGTNDFATVGAVLYTVRNGDMSDASVGVPYCEKYIIMKEGQRLPKHYHVFKTEDIINRANGVLAVYLWNTDAGGNQLATDVKVSMDGIEHTFKAGEEILIQPGNSISLAPHIAHIFGPKIGGGDLIVGEVSKVNDDNTDNYFLEPTSRFADIEEDEDLLHPLCNEYAVLG
ncbi:D-lyxose/D-mannose family sugar isomerase [Bacillota bacterium Meth-B3]|nr:D-lyxose/D-mannose family sugar isomerase [Christensenellaceae bacterium]MEA5065984.1 D-lyxose/D-mannose family sugar isomerase [Eubacteriales bacterium]MEA5069852.1 D-lyxose/D-mannose family sugar isomerase [Christensenellaceae bacterium]